MVIGIPAYIEELIGVIENGGELAVSCVGSEKSGRDYRRIPQVPRARQCACRSAAARRGTDVLFNSEEPFRTHSLKET